MDAYAFPAGSMGPKVEAAQDFARATGGRAIICALADVDAAVRGEKGTTIATTLAKPPFTEVVPCPSDDR